MGNCLKCGRKTSEKAVFCDNCLVVMDDYPIKPGTVIHLQPRPQRPERKSPENYGEAVDKSQLIGMRRTIRCLVVMTLILSVLLLVSAALLIHSVGNTPDVPAIGRNYTTTQQP